MKSQSEREVQTVTIATTLALVVGVVLAGAAVVWLLDVVADPSDDAQSRLFIATEVAAVVLSGRYLIRHRRSGQARDAHRLS